MNLIKVIKDTITENRGDLAKAGEALGVPVRFLNKIFRLFPKEFKEYTPNWYLSKDNIKIAMEQSKGFTREAAERLDCSHERLLQFIDQNLPGYLEEWEQKKLEKAEKALLEQATAGKTNATVYFLQTFGKEKGYSVPGAKQGNSLVDKMLRAEKRLTSKKEKMKAIDVSPV